METDDEIRYAFDDQLERWSHSGNPLETQKRAREEIERRTSAKTSPRLITTPPVPQADPPLAPLPPTGPSIDARYIAGRIVLHMWLIAVGLPILLTIIWEAIK
jgi:hypothetical protein